MFERIGSRVVQYAPSLLRIPLKITPFFLKKRIIEPVLAWQFQKLTDEGELTFLKDRWLKIEINDLDCRWFITLDNQRIKVVEHAVADVTFSANLNDLVLIMAHKQDPDTLFFQRRLFIEGDTELGLYVKNLMDSIELASMPAPLRILLQQAALLIEVNQQQATVFKGKGSVLC